MLIEQNRVATTTAAATTIIGGKKLLYLIILQKCNIIQWLFRRFCRFQIFVYASELNQSQIDHQGSTGTDSRKYSQERTTTITTVSWKRANSMHRSQRNQQGRCMSDCTQYICIHNFSDGCFYSCPSSRLRCVFFCVICRGNVKFSQLAIITWSN